MGNVYFKLICLVICSAFVENYLILTGFMITVVDVCVMVSCYVDLRILFYIARTLILDIFQGGGRGGLMEKFLFLRSLGIFKFKTFNVKFVQLKCVLGFYKVGYILPA